MPPTCSIVPVSSERNNSLDYNLVHIPESLPEKFLARTPTNQAIWWVLSQCCTPRHRVYRVPDPDEPTPLSRNALKAVCNDNYRKVVLQPLFDANVLDIANDFYWDTHKTGQGRCREFRLYPEFRGGPLREMRLTNPDLLRRIVAYTKGRDDGLRSDTHFTLRSMYQDAILIHPAAPFRNNGTGLSDLIKNGPERFEVRHGRVYTALVRVDKEDRQYVSFRSGLHFTEGDPICTVDVSSCLPLLLGVWLLEGSGNYGIPDADINWSSLPSPNFPSEGRLEGEEKRGEERLHRVVDNKDIRQRDGVLRWVNMCLRGELYETLRVRAGLDTTPMARVKEMVMQVLFGKHRQMLHSSMGKAIEALFPGVLPELIQRTVSGSALSCRLQEREGRIMIEDASATFLRDHPGVPFATLHDCLIVPATHVAEAEAAILAAFRTEVGCETMLKTKDWPAYHKLGDF